MIIRKAHRTDAEEVAKLTFMAMEDICYAFIGEKSPSKSIFFLTQLIAKSGNQYSFENVWVVEQNHQILASAIVYDGANLDALREPVGSFIKSEFGRNFNVEAETDAGEWYLDTIAVNPNQRGKGLGSKLIEFLIQEYVHDGEQPLGLLVDLDNPNAKKLYLNLGFKVIGQKNLTGKKLEHLQRHPVS